MPVTINYARQFPRVAVAEATKANFGAGNGITIALPQGALLLGIDVFTETAFNTGSTGTATLTVSDGTTTFASAVDVKTAGAETVTNVPKYYPAGGTLTITMAEVLVTIAATVGRTFVVPRYGILNVGDEVYG